ncbi:hypothetical protein HHI36_012132 [Cryptolaemus montrouzieri]|uniref:Probable proline--tRNA ligase, mitochondrial n=1 Tax=Cryptolaemus montrouzieri TaxID=559131 RepID=A0ABD2NDC5_9CUCU
MYKQLKTTVSKNGNIQKLSRIFQPFNVIPMESQTKQKEKEIHSKSSKLMLELGIIKQSSPGCFNLLPLGIRALEKLTRIADEEMQSIGGQKVEFPTLINEKLWTLSGRVNEVKELFKLKDRHAHSYILGPTHEEIACELLSQSQHSYKDFPLILYQITNKFRDELKPRLGLIRSKQFCMKDMYSFDIDYEKAMETYSIVSDSYENFFNILGIEFHKVKGAAGVMGGSLSHEYHFSAEIGEDTLVRCSHCNHFTNVELVEENICPICKEKNQLIKSKGIEVGHTFFLGDRYSKPFNANFINKTGKNINLQMCCFGLGLTRILAASIETLSTDQEIRWPKPIAPYSVLIIPPKAGSKEEPIANSLLERLYHSLDNIQHVKKDILVDDRTDLTIGRRNIQGKKMGYPFIIVLGNRIKEDPVLFELHDVNGGIQVDLAFEDLLTYINEAYNK